MASPIVFPESTSPGKDATESAGRLINAYAERLPPGSPAQYVIRRAPGLVEFVGATSSESPRGIWFDGGDLLYVAYADTLYAFDAGGGGTLVDPLPASSVAFLAALADASNLSTYTFSSVSFGAADSERRIVVAIYDRRGAAAENVISSVTLGGVSATLVDDAFNILGGSQAKVSIYSANVPTGTTGDVVVAFANTAEHIVVGVWRLGATDVDVPSTAFSFNADVSVDATGVSIISPAGGAIIGMSLSYSVNQVFPGGLSVDFSSTDTADYVHGFSGTTAESSEISVNNGTQTSIIALAAWPTSAFVGGEATFAKNNAAPPDQVLVLAGIGAFEFDTSSVTPVSVNSETVMSVCFGEGYFFFLTPAGVIYASNINSTTVSGVNQARAEARAEPGVRAIYVNGELIVFCRTHTEIWASNGNPNPTGFPLNRISVVWRGLVGVHAVCGFEEGFEGGVFWVADDNSVRMLQGYQAATISTPDLERAIERCTNKSSIRMMVYDIDGHACIVVDLAREATWIYDVSEGGKWHERRSGDREHWRLTGPSVKAFGKWISGSHLDDGLYEISAEAYDEAGEELAWQVESIAMESFPARLGVSRMDFNYVAGVGTDAVPVPEVEVQWSDDGGHTWTDPVTRSLGEAGRRKTQVRVNRGGLTGVKGRRFRQRVRDPVYVGLLGGSMEVQGRR